MDNGARERDKFKGQTGPAVDVARGREEKGSLEKPAESNDAKPMIRCSNFILHAMG